MQGKEMIKTSELIIRYLGKVLIKIVDTPENMGCVECTYEH